jgi:type I restriction enzyme M protein
MIENDEINMRDDAVAVIPAGKIKCFIVGILRNNTPEEKVRQEMARSLVEEYGYDKKDIELEFPIKMGSSRKRIDIAIFPPDEAHEQKNIYIIVEAKKEDIKPSDKKEGVQQLESYIAACLNTSFAIWVGNERLAFGVQEKGKKRIISEVTDIPKFGETSVPRPTRGSLVPAVSLKQILKRIHNYIYVNQGFQKDKAFEELLKLIFVKVYDEQFSPSIQFYVLPEEKIKDVRSRLDKIFNSVKSRYKYIYEENDKIELNDRVLFYIVAELQRFSFLETETDIKGEAYEELVGPNLRGDRGEFFTPRNVCDLAVDMLFSLVSDDKLTSPGEIKILDPAVGTGGFLVSAVQKIKKLFIGRKFRHDQLRDLVKEVAESNIFGIDFNPLLVNVAQMNMVMHGDGSANIVHANSLDNPINWNNEAKDKISLGDFDLIITNPPFGTKSPIDSPEILDQYQIPLIGSRASLPPEQLFIERCLDFLKPGGFLAIVLPDSILSNPGLVWLRNWILTEFRIIASIDLPTETFEPSTGTQTSLLIMRKLLDKEKAKKGHLIYMAIPEKVGHDRRGMPIFRETPDGDLELDERYLPIKDDHLPLVVESFRTWLANSDFIVNKQR